MELLPEEKGATTQIGLLLSLKKGLGKKEKCEIVGTCNGSTGKLLPLVFL